MSAAAPPPADAPKHGRRAKGADETDPPERKAVMKGWGEETQKPDEPPPPDLPNVEAGVDAAVAAQPVELEDLSREVAAAPTSYTSQMPRLSELDNVPGSKWGGSASLPPQPEPDLDLSCLTQVLCSQLDDEDTPWVPEVMLVQLTSELLDGGGPLGQSSTMGGSGGGSTGGGGGSTLTLKNGPIRGLVSSVDDAAAIASVPSTIDLGTTQGGSVALMGSTSSPTTANAAAAGAANVSAAGRRRNVDT